VAAVGLDDGGFWYLLHALNPVTRALAIRHLRCHPRGPAPASDAWIAHLLATSPPVETSFGDIEGEMPLARATLCCWQPQPQGRDQGQVRRLWTPSRSSLQRSTTWQARLG
jgi:hypothetical protein